MGVDVYSRHPSTEVLCVGVTVDDNPKVRVVSPKDALPFFENVLQKAAIDSLIEGAGELNFIAHNAAFEMAIWKNTLMWPDTYADQWTCTMVEAYSLGLPGSLDAASAAVGIEIGKDAKGKRVMMQLCRPKNTDPDNPLFYEEKDHPHKFELLRNYCAQDVNLERQLYRRLTRIPDFEKKVWAIDGRINQRGVKIDVDAARGALEVVESETERLNLEMERVTNGFVPTCTANAALLKWIKMRGVRADSVDKASVLKMLKDEKTPDLVARALKLRQEAAKSSTAKLKRMVSVVGPNDRVRGAFQYHAASTGRWGGRIIQPQNLPRKSKLDKDQIEDFFSLISSTDSAEEKARKVKQKFGAPLSVISSCLRGFIVPASGNFFVGADYSSIEARVTAWLAGHKDLIERFRRGEDVYVHAASQIYGISEKIVSDSQRQVGKVAILALGFGGGVGAFQQMARGYGLQIADKEAEVVKNGWRSANQPIVKLWHSLEDAALRAMSPAYSGKSVRALGTNIYYLKNGSFLSCCLPSGRFIYYPYPEVRLKKTPWGEMRPTLTAKWVNSVTHKFERRDVWYGILTENVVQAIARDLLAHAMVSLDDKHSRDMATVMHVHDELVTEVPTSSMDVNDFKARLVEVMTELPPWAEGLPVEADSWSGIRYQK